MKTYRVWARITNYAYLDVKADSASIAERIAEESDRGCFTNCEDGEWDIISDKTEEVG